MVELLVLIKLRNKIAVRVKYLKSYDDVIIVLIGLKLCSGQEYIYIYIYIY